MAQAPSRCLNHPERTAVARCKQCHKPLCSRCAIKKPGGVFCSEDCFENMDSFQNRVEDLEARKGGGNIGAMIKKGAVLLVAAGILYYVFIVEGVRGPGDFVDMVKGFMP